MMDELAMARATNDFVSVLGKRSALRVAFIFVAVSAVWILFSDTAITRISQSSQWLLYAQTLKGLVYITLVGSLIYFLTLTSYRYLEQAHRQESQAALALFSSLALAMEYRDGTSGSHCSRMSRFVEALATSYGYSSAEAEMLSRAAMLHDVGKIGVPDSILRKPGPLTVEERLEMQRHVQIGVELLMNSQNPLMHLGAEVILSHHENWDGTGYPKQIAGQDIPESGRIVAVCDVFDALLSDRPYKRAWAFSEAVAEIRRLSGTKFDPQVVEAFENALPQFARIAKDC
jgi:putative two-component system response regulator